MRKVVFIADFYAADGPGGAEFADAVLLAHLRGRDFDVHCMRSENVDGGLIRDQCRECFFLVGNFTRLADSAKDALAAEATYAIYEHDHKYLKTRDPSPFEQYKAPPEQIVDAHFYRNAERIFCLSRLHEECIRNNLGFHDNVFNIGTSLWPDEFFDRCRQLERIRPKAGPELFSLEFSNPGKGFVQVERWAAGRQVEFLPEMSQRALLRAFAERRARTFVFFPQLVETFSRIVAEARMLGCNLVTTPMRIGMASEGLVGFGEEELRGELQRRTKRALAAFEATIGASCSIPGITIGRTVGLEAEFR